MANPRTSDDLFGAFLPATRITAVGQMGAADEFSFTMDGKHVIAVRLVEGDDPALFKICAEFDEGPYRTLLVGSRTECQAESYAIYRYLLNRWNRGVASARGRLRRWSLAGGLSVALGAAGVVGAGLWVAGGGSQAFQADKVIQQLLEAEAYAAPEVVASGKAMKPAVKVAAPSFLDKVSELKAPEAGRLVVVDQVEVAPIAPAPKTPESDLLARFGLPEEVEVGATDISLQEQRERYRNSIKNGIASFPNPDGILGKADMPVLQKPGGGTLEAVEDLGEFGLKP